MKQAFERKLGVLFGFSLAILFLIGVLQCHTINAFVTANRGVAQAHEVLEELAALQILVNDAAAGARDYSTTGDESYAESYRAAAAGVPLALQNLQRLTADNPGQRKKLAALGSLTANQIADGQRVIEMRSQRAHSDATQRPGQVVTSPKAKRDFQQAVSGMEAEGRRMLDQRNGAARITAREVTLIVTEGAALGFWLLVIAGLVIRHYVAERRRNKSAGVLSAQLLENMMGAVYLSDETGTILYVNPAAEAMFGYKAGELVSESITLLNDFPAEETGNLFDQIHDQLTGGGTWKGNLACRRKDDTRLTCYAQISALEACGKLHWICVVEETSARRPAEELTATEQIEEYARAS